MKITHLVIGILCILTVLSIPIFAYTTTKIDAPPTGFTTQQSTSVNVSGMLNASAYPAREFEDQTSFANITIMNKSCQSCAYNVHSSYSVNISNKNGSVDIFWNKTITLTSGYNWIYLNFTNASIRSQPFHAATEERIINIDPDQFVLNIFNMGIKFGDANLIDCSTATLGLIIFNASADTFRGCTTQGYVPLNTS